MSASFEHLVIEPHGEVTVMRLNRPPANALELTVAREFEAALDAIMQDPPRAIVVTGTGSFFSGGLDLRVVPQYSTEQQRAFLTVLMVARKRRNLNISPVSAATWYSGLRFSSS